MIVLPFRLQARASCPAHADLAAALSAEFGPIDAERLDHELNDLARQVADRPVDPGDQLAAVGAIAAQRLRAVSSVPADGLLVDRVARERCGHPDAVALVLVEVGARQGWPLGIVASPERLFVGHERLVDPQLLDPVSGRLRDAGEVEGPLRWRCAHESCARLLDELERRWWREGDVGRAIRAAELRLELPVDEDFMRRAEYRLRRLQATLN